MHTSTPGTPTAAATAPQPLLAAAATRSLLTRCHCSSSGRSRDRYRVLLILVAATPPDRKQARHKQARDAAMQRLSLRRSSLPRSSLPPSSLPPPLLVAAASVAARAARVRCQAHAAARPPPSSDRTEKEVLYPEMDRWRKRERTPARQHASTPGQGRDKRTILFCTPACWCVGVLACACFQVIQHSRFLYICVCAFGPTRCYLNCAQRNHTNHAEIIQYDFWALV